MEFCRTFFFYANRSFKQILEANRRIEKLVIHSITSFVLYLAYDIIVFS